MKWEMGLALAGVEAAVQYSFGEVRSWSLGGSAGDAVPGLALSTERTFDLCPVTGCPTEPECPQLPALPLTSHWGFPGGRAVAWLPACRAPRGPSHTQPGGSQSLRAAVCLCRGGARPLESRESEMGSFAFFVFIFRGDFMFRK